MPCALKRAERHTFPTRAPCALHGAIDSAEDDIAARLRARHDALEADAIEVSDGDVLEPVRRERGALRAS